MTLNEAKKSLDELKVWVDSIQPRHFQTNSDQDTPNITSLTEMQAGLTEVNTKIGNLLFKITEPADTTNDAGPNDQKRSGVLALGEPAGGQQGAAPTREGTPPAATKQPNKVS